MPNLKGYKGYRIMFSAPIKKMFRTLAYTQRLPLITVSNRSKPLFLMGTNKMMSTSSENALTIVNPMGQVATTSVTPPVNTVAEVASSRDVASTYQSTATYSYSRSSSFYYPSSSTSSSSYSSYYPRRSEYYTPSYSSNFFPQNKFLKLITAVEQADIAQIHLIALDDPTLIKKQTSEGDTVLHMAAKKGNGKVIGALASSFNLSFNINVLCSQGKTALFYAIQGGHTDAVKELCLLKADPNIIIDGEKALDNAIAIKSPEEIIEMICERGGVAQKYLKEMEDIFEKRTIKKLYANFLVSSTQEEEKMIETLDQNLSSHLRLTTGK